MSSGRVETIASLSKRIDEVVEDHGRVTRDVGRHLAKQFGDLDLKLHARFRLVDQRFDNLSTELGQRFVTIDQRFEKMDQRFEKVEQRLDGMDQRFNSMDERFNHVDRRFDRIEQSQAKHQGMLEQILAKLN